MSIAFLFPESQSVHLAYITNAYRVLCVLVCSVFCGASCTSNSPFHFNNYNTADKELDGVDRTAIGSKKGRMSGEGNGKGEE